MEYGACSVIALTHFAVFDPITFEAWGTNFNGENPDHGLEMQMPMAHADHRVENYLFSARISPAQMQALADLLLSETIPDGYYVVLYTIKMLAMILGTIRPIFIPRFQNRWVHP